MFKVYAYLAKRPGLSTKAFIDHYEHRHIPLEARFLERARTRACVIEEHVSAR
jgi:hypothetical protein